MKILVDSSVLAELQERIDCHRDAVLWGKVCDLLAQPAQQQAIVMPERKTESVRDGYRGLGHAEGWNACLNEIARLNSKPVQQEVKP